MRTPTRATFLRKALAVLTASALSAGQSLVSDSGGEGVLPDSSITCSIACCTSASIGCTNGIGTSPGGTTPLRDVHPAAGMVRATSHMLAADADPDLSLLSGPGRAEALDRASPLDLRQGA